MNKNNFILHIPKLKNICVNSILGFALSLLIVVGFYSQGLPVNSINGTEVGEKCLYRMVYNQEVIPLLSTDFVASQRFGISNCKTHPLSADHSSTSDTAPVLFIFSEDLPADEVDNIDLLNISILIKPEIPYYLPHPLITFVELPVENFILSCLQTVVLLN